MCGPLGRTRGLLPARLTTHFRSAYILVQYQTAERSIRKDGTGGIGRMESVRQDEQCLLTLCCAKRGSLQVDFFCWQL